MSILRSIKPEALDLYLSIDELPIYNWWKINETNDLTRLLKQRKEVTDAKQIRQLADLWDKLFDEFIDAFGVPDRMRKILLLKTRIQILENDLTLTGDRTILAFIKMRQIDLSAVLKQEKTHTVNAVDSYLVKFLGVAINPRTTSVQQYYKWAKDAQDDAKARLKATVK